MSVIPGDLKHRHSANNPSNDTDTVGGAKTASDVGAAIGNLLHTRTANPDEADADKLMYKKTFITNTNATTALTSSKIYLPNAMDDVASNGVVKAVSDHADDDNTVKLVIIGEDAANQVQTEDLTLNGVGEVTGALTFSKVFWIELRVVASGALIAAVGNITIKVDNIEKTILPSSLNCCMSIVKIGLVGTLDDSATVANAVTAPGGISFTKPRTLATGIAVANAGSLTAASGQGVWWKQTVEGGLIPAPELSIAISIHGSTA